MFHSKIKLKEKETQINLNKEVFNSSVEFAKEYIIERGEKYVLYWNEVITISPEDIQVWGEVYKKAWHVAIGESNYEDEEEKVLDHLNKNPQTHARINLLSTLINKTMLYLPKFKTKILLILLLGLLSFHFCFLASKSLTASADNLRIANASDEQYQNYLNTIYNLNDKRDFISNTRATYLFNLPEEFSLYIFAGYFIIASGFIIFSKLNSTNTKDEEN